MNSFEIEYNGTFLDLVPNQSIEIERINPLFTIESAIAEYSTPISITASDHNVKKLGPDVFFDLHGKCKKKFNVKFYDSDGFAYNAILNLDKSTTNRLHPQKGYATGFLLIGTSKFYNELNDRKASDLDYESDTRIFNFTSFNPYDNSGGYWQHFHESWNNNLDFIIGTFYNEFTFTNPMTNNDIEVGFVNKVDVNNQLIPYYPIAIQLRVKYVMKRLVVENGWSFDDSEMVGTDWERLFLFNPKPIDYLDVTIGNLGASSFTTKNRLQLFLGKYISPELTCSELFFELCKHYGWSPIVDFNSNVVKIIPLRKANDGEIKNFTKFASEIIENDFSGGAKIISFKNTFPSGDSSIQSFDKTKYSIAPPVFKYSDLPLATAAYDNRIIFVYTENKWYTIDLNQNNQREWYPVGDNIFDAEIPDNTETVESKVSTFPMFKRIHRQTGEPNNYVNYYVSVPVTNQNPNGEWGIRTLLWLGMAYEFDKDSVNTAYRYPQLSSIRCLYDGTEIAAFSNVFNHLNPANNIDLGIIPYWFKKWTDISTTSEINEQKLFLPLNELRNLNWTDIIELFNVPYFIKSYIEPRPYNNFIQAKLQRVFSVPFQQQPLELGEKVYLKITKEDIRDGLDVYLWGLLYSEDVTEARFVISAYADALGTIPLNVLNLNVKLSFLYAVRVNNVTGPYSSIGEYQIKLKGNKVDLGKSYVTRISNGITDIDYNITPQSPYIIIEERIGGNYNLTDWVLLPSPDYEIIP